MSTQLGMNAKLLYKTGGVAGGGNFIEISNIRDLTLNLEKGEADVSTRGNNGWRARVGTLKDASLEFEMVWDTEDEAFEAIRDAFLDNTIIGFQVLDRESGQGLQADWEIMTFSRNEPLEEAITVSVTARIARSDTPPEWVGGT